jgi:RimJ/RimL family protein N-acetyltransferase
MNVAHWVEHGFGLWMLRHREGGAVIGRAVLRHLDVDGADEVEIGYGFLPEFWGRGLATEVARACVPTNVTSRRVMEKAGLTYEREISHQGVAHLLFRRGQERPSS